MSIKVKIKIIISNDHSSNNFFHCTMMFIILTKQLFLSTNISSVVEQQKIIFIIFMFDTRSNERFNTLWRCKARHNIYIQEKLVFNQNNKLVSRILDNHLCKYIECPEIELLLVFNMSIQLLAIELENNKAFMILNIIISILSLAV